MNVLKEYEWHVYQQESHRPSSLPYPSLTNDILPMFTHRWASGQDQHTREFFHKLEPALQLTSLLLTESYPLRWFSHLTFGERRPSPLGTYIVPTPYSISPEAISQVKANLRELGKVITFMFRPRGWYDSSWGITYSDKSSEPQFHDFFREEDWPPARSHKGHARPVIMMNACFQEYFRRSNSATSSVTEHYRALLTFAITLGHEVAHAYEFWLGASHSEPRWCYGEKYAELGFSWEHAVIGHVLNPMTDPGKDQTCFPKLCSTRLEEYATEAGRERLLGKLKGRTSAQFTTRDVFGSHRNWPLLNPREFRGAKWSLSRDATAIVASIYAVPSQWVVDWFQKDVWARRVMEWKHLQAYRPPPLDNAFMIIYERNAHGAQVQRPLNPFFDVDAYILQQRAEQKLGEDRATRRDQGFGYSWK